MTLFPKFYVLKYQKNTQNKQLIFYYKGILLSSVPAMVIVKISSDKEEEISLIKNRILCWKDFWRPLNLNYKESYTVIIKNRMAVPQEIKHRATIWSSNLSSGNIYPKETKSLSQRGICTPKFVAILFIIARVWKQAKCLSTKEWI